MFRCGILVLLESLYKVALIRKTTVHRSLFNRDVTSAEHLTGAFYPIVIKIIDRCAARQSAEISAEILGIHSGYPCELLETYVLGVMIRDVVHYTLKRVETLDGNGGIRGLFIELVIYDGSDQKIQITLCHKFISLFFLGEHLSQRSNYRRYA